MDFMQLLEAAERLCKLADALDPIQECLRRESNNLYGMSIGNTEYDIIESIEHAEMLSDEIISLKRILEKIISHYQITEEEQVRRVQALGEGIISDVTRFSHSSDSQSGIILNMNEFFSGHYIINEDWLNDLSDEWRDR